MTRSPNCVFFMDRCIRGIAVVVDEVFVIRDEQSHVSVYDADTLRKASRNIPINVSLNVSPQHLAGCSYDKALYIYNKDLYDGDESHILRVNLTKNSLAKWRIPRSFYQVSGLSVTAKHTLLVTVLTHNCADGVIEYTSTGVRMREIRFESDIQLPRQILQLPSDNFIVCHHGGNKYPSGRVCVVNILGEVVNSYDGQEGQDEGLQLHTPCSIAMDDKNGRIFVADRGNHRILMINTDLRYLDSKDSLASYRCTVKAIQHAEMLCGVTVVRNKIFLIGDFQPKVSVYDSHSLTALRNIDLGLPDMKSPRGLAGCSYNNALYIIDQSRFIHRVDLTSSFVTRWEMKEIYNMPESLSVTAQHTLLVTVRMSDASGWCGVVEYTSEGEQKREIRFDKSIDWAWHTIQLSGYQFIVCHGLLSKHRVCKIYDGGNICESYGGERGAGKGELSEPRSLAIDFNYKCIFVADSANSRVLMLDTDLNYLGQVHTPPDFTVPRHLYFDSSTERLFVSESSGRLLIIGLPD